MALDVVVIGAGASGLMAAQQAAEEGASVVIVEKTDMSGKKLRIAGKGRGNLTNDCDISHFLKNFPGNGRFLQSALHRFDNHWLQTWFVDRGVALKVERGGRVFPVSDDADQAAAALEQAAKQRGVQFRFQEAAAAILMQNGRVSGIRCRSGTEFAAGAVIVACGGGSYPGTGSTGDGWSLARQVGHRITDILPSLVPLRTAEPWPAGLSGLTLRNVNVQLQSPAGSAEEFGELLFTHFGVSGPTILTLSRSAARWLAAGQPVTLNIDLKPALAPEQLDQRLQRDFQRYSRKQISNGMQDLLPQALIPVILEAAAIEPTFPVHQLSREQRRRIGALLKRLQLTISASLPLAAAIVTQGGVCVKEVNPKTMESKRVSGLFFCGEVLDVDGYTGGFNLQAAFSTGASAGSAAARQRFHRGF